MAIFTSIFRISLGALVANKLRSGLTFLGIIIGVTSVMTIVSALEGMQAAIREDLETLGPSTFMVAKMMTAMSEQEFLDKIKRKPITVDMAEAVEENCVLCDKISPRAFEDATVKYGSEKLNNITVMGGSSNFIDIVDMDVAQGQFHSPEDDLYKRKVAFVGDLVRETFFEGTDPLGKTIKIEGDKYMVIGVAKRRGQMFGESQDNFLIIPFSTFIGQFGEPRRQGVFLTIKAASVEQLEETMDEVRVILRSYRKVPYSEPDDFDLMTADNVLDLLNQFTRLFRLSLIGISAISLVIGGIVVMNIMMVSVTERTREIGIRKSIGAKQRHILMQFLFEAVVLTLTGGLVGIVAGFLIARVLTAQIDMSIQPSAVAIIAGLVISTGIGLIFGVYPAMKAARLDPIKALSYE